MHSKKNASRVRRSPRPSASSTARPEPSLNQRIPLINNTVNDRDIQHDSDNDGYRSENDRGGNENDVPDQNNEVESESDHESSSDESDFEAGIQVNDFDIGATPAVQTRSGNAAIAENIERPPFSGEGPQFHVDGQTVEILDFIRLFLDDYAMHTFVEQTNSYARSVNRNVNSRGWPLLTADELWHFFSIVIFCGTISVRERRKFWDKNSKYYNNWIASTMECGRFEDILFCLHWVDTAQFSTEEKKQKNREDPFWPLTGFLEHLAKRFQACYTPGQDIDTDEQGIPTKCYHSAVQYNKDKPHKWFFKVWSLNCAKTSYMWNFSMYKGSEQDRDESVPASSYPVEFLTRNERLHHKGHIMHADNYFNSPKLVYLLLERGIHCNGTIRANRFTKRWKIHKTWFYKKKNQAARGTMRAKKLCYIRDNKMHYAWVISWIDNKAVNLVTTFKPYANLTQRNSKNPDGRHVRLVIRRPTNVKFYNKGMGGTDSEDHKLALYRSSIVSRKWPIRIIFHFLLASVINALILYRLKNHLEVGDKYYILGDFIEAVAEEMKAQGQAAPIAEPVAPVAAPAADRRAAAPPIATKAATSESRWKTWESCPSRLTGRHFPVHYKQTDCRRRVCKMPDCNSQVNDYCRQCDVPLCIEDCDGTSCFEKFHTLESLDQRL